jgi:hypothetical protein
LNVEQVKGPFEACHPLDRCRTSEPRRHERCGVCRWAGAGPHGSRELEAEAEAEHGCEDESSFLHMFPFEPDRRRRTNSRLIRGVLCFAGGKVVPLRVHSSTVRRVA